MLYFYCYNFYLGPPVEERFAYETASVYDTLAIRRLVRVPERSRSEPLDPRFTLGLEIAA
jgi:hypothetical protein